LLHQGGHGGAYGLDEQHEMFRQTFKKFAEDQVMPLAEKVHRHDLLIPEEIMKGLMELGLASAFPFHRSLADFKTMKNRITRGWWW
jgi:hypothetical protein